MENKMFYLETNSISPYYNLAFEEYVFTHKTENSYLILWQNDNTVVVGSNQNTIEEINHNFVEENNVNVVRRATGGGAVYHDLGNINYSFITDFEEDCEDFYTRFTQPVITALHRLGLNAEKSGRNDILIDGSKVSGTAQRIAKGRILHHGTLLFSSDLKMIGSALNVSPLKYQSKSTKSVKARVGNVKDFMKNPMDIMEFWEHIKKNIMNDDVEVAHLSDSELDEVKNIMQSKYLTWEWNYGKSPNYNFRNAKKWDKGILDARVHVERGKIEEIVFHGDFLATMPIGSVLEALKGCEFNEENVEKALEPFNIPLMFGGISKEEILDTLFNV